MYEETRNSIDWKGLFLKVIIAFLIVFIAVKGYTMLKGKDTNKNTQITTTKENIVDSKDSTIFTENLEKLRKAGEKYYKENPKKVPSTEGNTTMVTLNDLVASGVIKSLTDEDGKTCDGESSYVTATKEDGETKLKANLVCGKSTSYALVYMGENDSSETKTYTYSETRKEDNKTTGSGCVSNSCAPSVNVSTVTKVENTISTGGKVTSSNKGNTTSSNKGNTSSNKGNSTSLNKNKYYTIKFDRNGGTVGYPNQTVRYNRTVAYPGSNQKRGCSFRGWYLNGVKYDFDTPVTKNITLKAMYNCSNSRIDDDDYDRDERDILEDTHESYVYTMGWDTYGTDRISISHTLQLPEELDDEDIIKVKISKIEFDEAITTTSLANKYDRLHNETFFYRSNGWESDTRTKNSLATIRSSAVRFSYSESKRYKTLDDALDEGFDVTWTANDVYKQCKTTFSVNGVDNLCNYGIVYRVEWTYKYYR